ncbi:hypothetical protein RvY_02749 [Ramazzottius varieornatus]|uniref:YEATS domain-containing protein n=1 Tax=Ramazzottius varieornatus TaxID=947166 RepID=A0A1D1UKS8_RAMVA|nr:hypothetical protein RvY_02749 [Ramazzottius varieornatus]
MSGTLPRVQSDDWGFDSGGRQKNVQIVRPFLIGCRSKRLPESIPNPYPPLGAQSAAATNAPGSSHSHKWVIYLRPYTNEDLSVWIKKVQFKLHDTYPNCLRSLNSAPFEVEETGWGEFEVQVKVFFVDPNERQVTLWTWVRLFKKDTEHTLFVNKDDWLVAEYYDEFVFNEPSAMMVDLLRTNKRLAASYKPEVDYDKLREETIQKIRKGRERVTPEIQAILAQFEVYKTLHADILALYRGEPQPSTLPSVAASTTESEFGGASSQASQPSGND